MEPTDVVVMEFENALLQIDRIKAAEIFEKCHTDENSFSLLEQMTIHTLERIGSGWEAGTVSLSQVYMSGVICEELMDRYVPKHQVGRIDIPRIAIGVLLDHHALGKRIVHSILRAGGLDVMDFGQGLSVDELVARTMENQIEYLLLSTLMLASALKVKTVREQLSAKGCFPKIIVGGAPFRLDKDLWHAVGADADGKNASNILKTLEALQKGVVTDELF